MKRIARWFLCAGLMSCLYCCQPRERDLKPVTVPAKQLGDAPTYPGFHP